MWTPEGRKKYLAQGEANKRARHQRKNFDWRPIHAKCAAWLREKAVTSHDLWDRLRLENLVDDREGLYESFKTQVATRRNREIYQAVIRDGTARRKKNGETYLKSLGWDDIITEAAEIVKSYSTGVTLRQLFYQLVARQIFENSISRYRELAKRTAALRLDYAFPDLVDDSREIVGTWGDGASNSYCSPMWENPLQHFLDECLSMAHAARNASDQYRLDERDGQEWRIVLAIEKRGLMRQLRKRFDDRPIKFLALGGQTSTPIIKKIWRELDDAGNADEKLVVIYAGDYDPSGIVIDKSFEKRANYRQNGRTVELVRVALNKEQVEEFDLPINPAKKKDSNYKRMVEEEGEAMQVEVDALDPDTLLELFENEVENYWDSAAYDYARDREEEEREQINEENEPIAEAYEELADKLASGLAIEGTPHANLSSHFVRGQRFSKRTPEVTVMVNGQLIFSNEITRDSADDWRNL